MLITELSTIEVEKVTEIVCNKCGEFNEVHNNNMSVFEGLGEVDITFGYFSEHFGDGTHISFALCEKCLYELVQTFKVDPYKEEKW